MDRRLAGTLLICMVVSTILTLFIAGERGTGITVVENAYPVSIGRSREQGTFPFHLGMVARQHFALLEIQCYCLRPTEWKSPVTLEEADLDGISTTMDGFSAIREMCESLGGSPQVFDLELELERKAATLRIVDFTDVFLSFLPGEIQQFPEGGRSGLLTSPGCVTVFALAFDETGQPHSCYEGVRDFFPDRELLLSDLHLRRDDTLSSYISSRMAPQPEGGRILDAPRGGRLLNIEVNRDEGFEIGFSVNAAWLQGGMPLLQVFRLVGDLSEVLVLANFVG